MNKSSAPPMDENERALSVRQDEKANAFWALLLILVATVFSSTHGTAEESPERNSTERIVSSAPFKGIMEPGSPVKTSDGCGAEFDVAHVGCASRNHALRRAGDGQSAHAPAA
jgi:hypothetical protein